MNFKSISFSQRVSTLKTVFGGKHLGEISFSIDKFMIRESKLQALLNGSTEDCRKECYIHQKVVAPIDS